MTTALETRVEVDGRRERVAAGPSRAAVGHHSAVTAQTEVRALIDLPGTTAPLAAIDLPGTTAPPVPPATTDPAATDLPATSAQATTVLLAMTGLLVTTGLPVVRRTEWRDRARIRLSARRGLRERRGPTGEMKPLAVPAERVVGRRSATEKQAEETGEPGPSGKNVRTEEVGAPVARLTTQQAGRRTHEANAVTDRRSGGNLLDRAWPARLTSPLSPKAWTPVSCTARSGRSSAAYPRTSPTSSLRTSWSRGS